MFQENLLNAELAKKGMTKGELAKVLHIDPSTLTRKLKMEGNFTRDEINTIIEVLDIQDPKPIFFAENVESIQN